MKNLRIIPALRIAFILALMGGSWILIVDQPAASLSNDPNRFSNLQPCMGWGLILATSALVYNLVRIHRAGTNINEPGRIDVFEEPGRGILDRPPGGEIVTIIQGGSGRENDPPDGRGQKFRALIENSMDAIALYAPDGKILFQSPASTRILGYSPEELVGENVFIFIAAEDRELAAREFNRLLDKPGSVMKVEIRSVHKNGEIRWLEVIGSNRLNESGIDALVANYRDITERKTAEEALKRKFDELMVLHSVALAETSSRDADELIQQVTTIIGDALYPDNCGVLLINAAADALKPHFSYRGTNVENLRTYQPLSAGITGLAASLRKPIRVGDVSAEPAYIEATTGIRSEMCAPLISGEKIIGVLNVESRNTDAFNEDDERLLTTIAGGLATSIERLQLFEIERKRRREAEVLRQATANLTTTNDPGEVFTIILQAVSDLVEFTSASIELIDGEYLEIVAHKGLPQGYRYVGERTLIHSGKWGADLWKPIIISDVQADDRFVKFPGTGYIRGWMGIPLITQDKLIGYINLDSDQSDYFNEDQAALVQTFANQAATAIENSRLFQQEAQRTRLIKALSDLANELAAIREIEPVLDIVASRTFTMLNASRVAIYLLQDGDSRLKVAAEQGDFMDRVTSSADQFGKELAARIVRTGVPEIVPGTAKDTRRNMAAGDPHHPGGPGSLMSAPLILRGKSIGAINVWRPNSNRSFNETELTILASIAHQTSIAIETGRLFEETIRRARESTAIAEVGRDVSSTLQLDQVLERIALYARELLKADTSAVYLFEPEHQRLHAVAAIGVDSEEIKNFPIQAGRGILGSIAINKVGEIVNDPLTDPRVITIEGTAIDPLEHLMAVPVVKNEQLTGLLVVWKSGMDLEFKSSDLEFLTGLSLQAGVAIENARLFQSEQIRRQESENLRVAATAMTSSLEPQHVLETILVALQEVIPYDSASILQLENDHVRITAAKGLPDPESVVGRVFPSSNRLLMEIKDSGKPLIVDDCMVDPRFEKWATFDDVRGWMGMPLVARGQVIGYITLDSLKPRAFSDKIVALGQIFAHQAAAALDNARLYAETRQRMEDLEVVSRISIALRAANHSAEMLPIVLNEIKTSMKTQAAGIWLFDKAIGELQPQGAIGWLSHLPRPNFKPGEGIVGRVFAEGGIHVTEDFSAETLAYPENAPAIDGNWGGITVPIRTSSEIIGVLMVAVEQPRLIESHQIRLITTIAEMSGNAIYRSNLYERSEEQIRRLTTLQKMDAAITSNMDLHITLGTLTDQLTLKMGVDAAAILVFNPETQMLDYYAASGFEDRGMPRKSLGIGEGRAGQILLNRRTQLIRDLEQEPADYPNPIAIEEFSSYYAVPLTGKGATKGVLEMYFRDSFEPTPDWLEFLDTLAGQATIAIDNAQLFENLQRSNQELSLAYDTTLEGWGKALELRDKETQGHTRRVTDLTLRLARRMGIPESEFTNIRRGTLLHDIGKMGVPDTILRKDGPLTLEELEEMRNHPQYAYDLLSPITYLRSSLEIPYCHHEWWNGKGYPRGLKGEEIPLSARIFAVVDVWDALFSQRPYRKAWPRKKVLEYIQDLEGKQFDPDVVQTFLQMIDQDMYHSQRRIAGSAETRASQWKGSRKKNPRKPGVQKR